jgi:adenylosuccinate lyase
LGEAAPGCREIVHLGATSCYVTDNTDLILIRESLSAVRDQLVGVIHGLAEFAEWHRDVPCLGYTHFQPAQLTTVGKRACLWCYDFVIDLDDYERRLSNLKFRGAKGTTGTQASFLALFQGDHAKVRELDRRVAAKMGFDSSITVTGQTYSRKIDSQVLDALSGLAQSSHKTANDWRLLAHEREWDEPSESDQVGSSAMAYKKNPMRSERLCSISRWLMGLPSMAAQTHASQWLERTLDDSAARRLYLPQAFLAADAVMRILLNIIPNMQVNPSIIARIVANELPFMATENIMMAAVAAGEDRQSIHERIRLTSKQVTSNLKNGSSSNDLIDRLRNDPLFAAVSFEEVLRPERYVGRAPEQVTEFIQEVVAPIRNRYPSLLNQSAALHV